MIYKFLLIPFLFGLFFSEKLYLTGEIYIGEIIAIGYIVFNFKKLRLSGSERTIIVFALLWAVSQLISDLLNKSELVDAVKGISAPIVFSCTLIFFINYTKDKIQRLPSLLLGITIGELVHLLLFPTEYFLGNFWKWGFGQTLLGIFVIYFSFFIRTKNNALLFGTLVFFLIVSLYFDGRSLAIFPLLAALAYKIYYGKNKSIISKKLSDNWAGIRISFIILPALFIINFGASTLFSSPAVLAHFSSDSAAKYKTQAAGAYGILLGGRSEILASGQAFLDKPLLGHGSWAKDKSGYHDKYANLMYQLKYTDQNDIDLGTNLLIPAHSFLMGALVWAGFAGGLFWLVVLNSTLKLFIKNLNLFPFYYYVGMIGLIWNIFFSPFGANARWSTAVFLAAFFSYSSYLKFNTRVAA